MFSFKEIVIVDALFHECACHLRRELEFFVYALRGRLM
jgi:hypothetical protein